MSHNPSNIPVVLFCGNSKKRLGLTRSMSLMFQLHHLESQGLVKVVYQTPEFEFPDYSGLEDRVMCWYDEVSTLPRAMGVKEVKKKRAVKPYFRKNERY